MVKSLSLLVISKSTTDAPADVPPLFSPARAFLHVSAKAMRKRIDEVAAPGQPVTADFRFESAISLIVFVVPSTNADRDSNERTQDREIADRNITHEHQTKLCIGDSLRANKSSGKCSDVSCVVDPVRAS
jgi:hypothetical protein